MSEVSSIIGADEIREIDTGEFSQLQKPSVSFWADECDSGAKRRGKV